MITCSLLFTLAVTQAMPATSELTLTEAMHQARAQNLDIQAAQARLKQAREISKKVWSGYLPQLTASGSYTRNNIAISFAYPTAFWIRDVGDAGKTMNGPTAPGDPTKPYSADNPPGVPSNEILYPGTVQTYVLQPSDQVVGQLSVSQAIIAPALWPAIHNAYIAERVIDYNVDNARREILFAVAQTYLGAVGLRESVAVQERLLAVNREHEHDAEVRFHAGVAPKIALVRAQIDRARSEQDLCRGRNNYEASKSALAALLDRQPDFDVIAPAEDPSAPEETPTLLDEALRLRPDVQAARANYELARKTRDGVWYQYAPSLALQAYYRATNFTGFANKYDSWAVTLGLNWTLWDGGLRESLLRENSAKTVEALALAKASEVRVRDEIRRAALDLSSARANRITAQEQVRLARENMEMIMVNFKAGAATQVEVSDAQTALRSAELGLIAETLNAQLAAIRLSKAAGQFDPG